MELFIRLDGWLSAILFASLMVVGWQLGRLVRRRTSPAEDGKAPSTRIEDAGLGLFGLLLAFCFSGAAGRYEARKELLRDDAIAIGDFATTASILEDPDRADLNREIRTYVAQRMAFGPMRLDDPRMPALLEEGRASHARMGAIVRRAIAGKNSPTIHTPLLNGLNGLTSAHDKRLYGVRDHAAGSVVLMLVLFGVFTTFTMGRLHEQQENRRRSMFRVGTYIALVALVFFVIIDLEQPRRGILRVSQVPMQELLTSLEASR